MANNLKKFATAADYSAATLNYPAVSWIVSGDTVKYDLSGSTPVVNDKLVKTVVYTGSSSSVAISLPYNSQSYVQTITSLTVNGVSVEIPTQYQTYTISNISTNSVITIEVGIDGSELDFESNEIDTMGNIDTSDREYLIPSKFTSFYGNPHDSDVVFVLLATTPPALNTSSSSFQISALYVPDEAVNTYKYDETSGGESQWKDYEDKTYPISDYSGNLPV